MNVVTWNMQGATGQGENKWNADVTRLFRGDAEIVCLQESGFPPNTAIPIPPPPWLAGFAPPPGLNVQFLQWNIGTGSRPFLLYILWVETDLGAHRNNVAIVSRHMPMNLIYVNPGLPGGRPAVGFRIPYGFGTVDVFSLHAFSGGGGDAPNLLNNINATGGSWFAAGDYNRDPGTWGPPPPPPGALLCGHNPVATHPGTGTNLDYAFKSPGPAVYGIVFENFIVSDHFPVGYQV